MRSATGAQCNGLGPVGTPRERTHLESSFELRSLKRRYLGADEQDQRQAKREVLLLTVRASIPECFTFDGSSKNKQGLEDAATGDTYAVNCQLQHSRKIVFNSQRGFNMVKLSPIKKPISISRASTPWIPVTRS